MSGKPGQAHGRLHVSSNVTTVGPGKAKYPPLWTALLTSSSSGLAPQIKAFLAHEKRHLATFAEVLRARGIPRCKSYWFCGVGGFALGLVTSLCGQSGIMACTAAVETVVAKHLVEQLAFLECQGDREAAVAVQSIVSEEEKSTKQLESHRGKIARCLNRWARLSPRLRLSLYGLR